MQQQEGLTFLTFQRLAQRLNINPLHKLDIRNKKSKYHFLLRTTNINLKGHSVGLKCECLSFGPPSLIRSSLLFTKRLSLLNFSKFSKSHFLKLSQIQRSQLKHRKSAKLPCRPNWIATFSLKSAMKLFTESVMVHVLGHGVFHS